MLSVENSVSDPIPEFPHESEKGSKRPSVVNRQDARDVLPSEPSGPDSANKISELDCELTTVSVHSFSETGDAEILTRCSSDHKVDCSILIPLNVPEIPGIDHAPVMVFEHGRGEFFNLGERSRFPPKRMPRDGGRFDAAAD
jgi:hypothetical protein